MFRQEQTIYHRIFQNRPAMNYDKLSRSLRQYYKKGIMKKTERSQRLVYQFCHPYHVQFSPLRDSPSSIPSLACPHLHLNTQNILLTNSQSFFELRPVLNILILNLPRSNLSLYSSLECKSSTGLDLSVQVSFNRHPSPLSLKGREACCCFLSVLEVSQAQNLVQYF